MAARNARRPYVGTACIPRMLVMLRLLQRPREIVEIAALTNRHPRTPGLRGRDGCRRADIARGGTGGVMRRLSAGAAEGRGI